MSAANLTRQLLAFGRRQVLRSEALDLGEVVQRIENLLVRLAGERVEVVIDREEGLRLVRADPSQIEQVVLNLVANARDAMPEGGKVMIAMSNVDRNTDLDEAGEAAAGEYVKLSVSDDGAGLDPDTKRRLFEPFFTTKEMGKGTGLGLATVHGIVKQSAGHIEVESRLDHGTTITVYLPATEGEAQPTSSRQLKRARTGSGTVLVAEDEPGVRAVIARALQRAGYRVACADCAADALTRFEELRGEVDLLVSDVVMPGESGLKLAAKLRERKPDLEVLFVSGYAADALGEDALGASAPLLRKPFTAEELVSRVHELRDRARSSATA